MGKEQPINIISSTYLLDSLEIKRLSKQTTAKDLEAMCVVHPTNEDQVCYDAFRRISGPFVLHYFFPTQELTNYVKAKTCLPFERILDILSVETLQITGVVPGFSGGRTEFHYTHHRETSKTLSWLAEKYSKDYLHYMGRFTPEPIKVLISEDPAKCDRLRLFCTYSPQAIGQKSAVIMEFAKDPQTLKVQSATMKAAQQIFGTKFILIG